MSIIQRIKDIMNSNTNAVLDTVEDPEKMIDQYLRNATKDLAAVRLETASVMAAEKRSEKNLTELNAEIEKLELFAKRAVKAGEMEDAEKLISKKQLLETKVVSYKEIHAASVRNSNEMKEMHDKLLNDIKSMETKKEIMKGKIAATRARETVNKMGASSVKHGTTIGKLGDLEDKINNKFEVAISASELLNAPIDEASEIVEKYDSGASNSVSAELAKMAAELKKETE